MPQCVKCNKKISSLMVSVYTCKCKNLYCSKHKHNHDCSYDYYEKFCKEAEKTLQSIVPKKIVKI